MKSVTIKTNSPCIQEHSKINKVIATIDAKNIAKLLNVVGLTANPRKSKVNKVTKAICETLKSSPEDMRFKSKGLLISTSQCTPLQRGRFKLSFDDETYEGVLDGGHNMLAIGLYILEQYLGDESPTLRKVKNWDDFVDVWGKYKDDLSEVLEIFDFEVPIEIIYPTEDYVPNFIDSVLDISDARNNNSALTSGTKAHHKGYYNILKESLDPEVEKKVEWKDGEAGKQIRRDDIVAMSLIPLIALQEKKLLDSALPKINPINIYSGKAKCIEIFSRIFEHYADSNDVINNHLVVQALSLLKELPRLYDTIYKNFPDAARKNGLYFGKMGTVKIYEKGKTGGSYLKRSPLTKYYNEECSAKYPDGFIVPIFASLHALINVSDNQVSWAVKNPIQFIENHLTECTRMLVSNIKENNYNPQSVGKSALAYEGAKISFQLKLREISD